MAARPTHIAAGTSQMDQDSRLSPRSAVPQAPHRSAIGPYHVLGGARPGRDGRGLSAERADGQFEQRVALKLIKRGMDSDEILRRFLRRAPDPRPPRPPQHRPAARRRRRPAGPALVRDGARGRRADHRLLRRARASTSPRGCACSSRCATRCRYAHRNLVVHRDLKPSNILVTARRRGRSCSTSASPSCWPRRRRARRDSPARRPGDDAGVRRAGADPRRAGHDRDRRLRPRCGAVRAAHRPRAQRFERYSPAEVRAGGVPRLTRSRRASRSQARTRRGSPSRRQLPGDLDTHRAQGAPEGPGPPLSLGRGAPRGPSATPAGLPVQARPESGVYRGRKFVARHRIGVAARVACDGVGGGLMGTAGRHGLPHGRRPRRGT